MALGYSLGVLQQIREVTANATPQYKIEPYGLLALLKSRMTPGAIKNDSFDGHFKTVKIKRKKRFTTSQVGTEASCEVTNLNPYTEETVSIGGYRTLAVHVADETIAAYDAYASQKVRFGNNPESVLMQEHMDDVFTMASAILNAVDKDLVTLLAANIGVNRRTGNNAARALNIARNANIVPLNNAPTEILSDFQLNSMTGRPLVVGAGLMYNWALNQPVIGGPNASGIDIARQIANFDFFYDLEIEQQLGSNHIVVMEKDAIQLVEYLEYQGWKAGTKPGASTFGTVTLPMMQGGQLVPVQFDYQLRYNDCAQDFTVDDETVTLQKGYNLILSKRFGLYTIPTTAYRTGDPLAGNRGTLRYVINNDCDTCPDEEGGGSGA